MQGWIKLHRKLLMSDIFQNEKLLKVFVYCLLKASHKEHSQRVGLKTVELKEGQFIYGRNKASQDLNMNPSTVRNYIDVLETEKMLDIKSTNKYSVITVVNWELYQSDDEQEDNKKDSKRTAKGQQKDTNKNGKNVKEKTSCPKYSTFDLDMSKYLFQLMRENNPSVKEPNFDKWANVVRLMREKDNRTEEQIKYMIEWTQNHHFWKTNILSTDKLRTQFNQLILKVKAEKQTPQKHEPDRKPEKNTKHLEYVKRLRGET